LCNNKLGYTNKVNDMTSMYINFI